MLELRDLEVRYGAVRAVRGLSIDIRKGEIVGLIGPNGAGKSTTLNAIMGLVPIHGGEVLLGGARLRGGSPESIARRGIALVPEGRRIFGELSVQENLRLGLAARRSSEGIAGDLEDLYGLFPVLGQFARALIARPDVLLLDEPSLGLSPTMVNVVFETLRTVRERGLTVLLVEQRAQRTVSLADRSYVIANGELRLSLTPRDAADTAKMVAAYLS